MGIEALKQQLTEGKITQEQFAAELAKLLAAGTITQEEHDAAAATDTGGGQGGDKSAFTDEQMAAIQKMMQSEADKVRTKAAQEKKTLEDQLDALKTEKMTEEEKTKHELDKLRKQNEVTAAELLKDKVGFHTVKTLSAKNLPMDFDAFLAGESIEDTDARIAAFEKAWQLAIKTAVDEKFARGGDDPLKDKGGAGTPGNPWTKEHWNMTKQGQILAKDRTEANRLAVLAGRPGNY